MRKFSNKILIGALLVLITLAACNDGQEKKPAVTTVSTPSTKVINYGVVKTFPHDTTSFTEGLLVHEGKLYESTGSPEDLLYTRSLAGEVDLNTGQIIKKVELDRNRYFGEGITFLNGKLHQLTYKSKIGFIYDAVTFQRIGTFPIPSPEGWGLTTDGKYLIMSDGTNKLTYLDPSTYVPVKTLDVFDQNSPVAQLNELEFINGFLYANIYTSNLIVKIDTKTGVVVGKLDLSSLAHDAKSKYPNALELNGIAYDSTTNNIYVTGKFWPNIYQIQFDH